MYNTIIYVRIVMFASFYAIDKPVLDSCTCYIVSNLIIGDYQSMVYCYLGDGMSKITLKQQHRWF